MQARYYDPVIWRFMSNDQVDFVGRLKGGNLTHGVNRYVYANNNPLMYVDPNVPNAVTKFVKQLYNC